MRTQEHHLEALLRPATRALTRTSFPIDSTNSPGKNSNNNPTLLSRNSQSKSPHAPTSSILTLVVKVILVHTVRRGLGSDRLKLLLDRAKKFLEPMRNCRLARAGSSRLLLMDHALRVAHGAKWVEFSAKAEHARASRRSKRPGSSARRSSNLWSHSESLAAVLPAEQIGPLARSRSLVSCLFCYLAGDLACRRTCRALPPPNSRVTNLAAVVGVTRVPVLPFDLHLPPAQVFLARRHAVRASRLSRFSHIHHPVKKTSRAATNQRVSGFPMDVCVREAE